MFTARRWCAFFFVRHANRSNDGCPSSPPTRSFTATSKTSTWPGPVKGIENRTGPDGWQRSKDNIVRKLRSIQMGCLSRYPFSFRVFGSTFVDGMDRTELFRNRNRTRSL
ncbi:Hypothetical protein CINCED_3A013818 [Cinara cedri]|uniref:Uncharacterized protein n=1 Tax=Cinara cedri TaxID=506608 RepID=A0A5E4M218_9HEMI|nr:Hypothetical protein CINCED_3A013818 [Cinara cedri]